MTVLRLFVPVALALVALANLERRYALEDFGSKRFLSHFPFFSLRLLSFQKAFLLEFLSIHREEGGLIRYAMA